MKRFLAVLLVGLICYGNSFVCGAAIALDSISLMGAGGKKPAVSGGGGGGTLTFGIDATNYAGGWNTSTLPLVCPSAACLVSGSSSTQFGIGTASANRVVTASFGYSGAATSPNAVITGVMFNGTISGSACVGGTAATTAVDSAYVGAFNGAAAVWYASLPSGTTATVCFTEVGGNGWGGQGVVTVSYLNDSLGASHISVSSTVTASPPSYPGSCAGSVCTNTWSGTSVPSGGIGLAVGDTGDITSSSSWSGSSSPTKAVEANDGAAVTSPLVHWATSGNVTETVSTSSVAGFAGVIFAP